MTTANERAADGAVDRYYVGYLRDALPVLDSAENRLETQDTSHPDIIRAEVIAHKIKGNAALYDLPQLGELAKRLELALKSRAGFDEISVSLTEFNQAVRHIIQTGRFQQTEDICDTPEDVSPEVLLQNLELAPSRVFTGINNKSALVIFDNPWFEDFLNTYFRDGVEFNFRRSGAEAIQWLAANTPDIIICESDLPDVPGVTLMQFMRANGGAGKVPFIIAFPDNPDFTVVSEAIAAGAAAIVSNKSDAMQLAEQIQELLSAEVKRVLIIDDDEPVRDVLRNTFERADFKVETATDGMDALGRLGTKLPDLIILDRLMPRMNGEATLRELQASVNTGAVPVIVLTAMDNVGEASKWLMRGASEFIAKPFDPEEVLERARKLLNSKRGR